MYNKLKKLTDGIYPFHMPGHKRNPDFLRECPDITEITGADDLHHPEDMLLASEKRAAEFFNVKKTLFATSGSTALILAAIGGSLKSGEKLLIARNCHKSVYNAAYVNSLKTEYLMPETVSELDCYGIVTPEAVEKCLYHSNCSAVVITSPTYEGFVSDISGISKVCRKYGSLLIVDAAHGAHLGLSEYFLPSARNNGADIVIESAHKTLPCLTGAALLHICSDRVNEQNIKRAFSIYQSSSPSYPIMASIDSAIKELQYKGEHLFGLQSDRIDDLFRSTSILENLSIFRRDDHDKSKIIISCKNADISGFELKKMLLAEHKIECEMAMPNYVLALSSVADTALGFDKLSYALREIDKKVGKGGRNFDISHLLEPTVKCSIREAIEAEQTLLPLDFSVGRVSADFIYAYPPGSPIIAPGEIITASAISTINSLETSGANIYSTNEDLANIKCIK